jgi:NDP-sugar pyrophosphorylase family protein
MTGVGQRFIDAGFERLKPLIETGIGTMIQNVLNGFPSIEAPICIINEVGKDKELLKSELLRIRPKARIVEIPPHKNGPSFAIWEAREHIDLELPVVVSYCDFAGIWSEKEFLERVSLSDGLIQTYTGFHPHMIRNDRFAYVKKDTADNVIGIQEKLPYTNCPMSEEASSGIYGFKSGEVLIQAIRSQLDNNFSLNGEFYTSLTYRPLIEQKKEVKTIQMQYFFQWGTPEDLRDFNFWVRMSQRQLPSGISANDSSVVILAAGSGSRVAKLARVEKPFISVFGNPLWLYSASIFQKSRERIVFSNSTNQSMFSLKNPFGFKFAVRDQMTRSQAESAFLALEEIEDHNKPVHILACDNLFLSDHFEMLNELVNTADLIVWVTRDYAAASNQKEQFSWVSIGTSGEVAQLRVKAENPDPEAMMLIGNFSFKNAKIASNLIEKTLRWKSDSSAEVYLDWVTEIAIKEGFRVCTFEVRDFWAIGTPNEFKTLQYWSDVFGESTVIK